MGNATVEAATATYHASAIQTSGERQGPRVPMAKPAAAQMNSTLGLTTVSASAVAPARAGVSLLRLCIHFGRVRRLLAGQPSVDAENDQRGADDDPQPRRPARRLVAESAGQAGDLEEDRGQRGQADQPAGQEGQPRRPRPRRVQHQHCRDDGQWRERDHQRQRDEFGAAPIPTSSTLSDLHSSPGVVPAGFPVGALADEVDVHSLGVLAVGRLETNIGHRLVTGHVD